MFGNAFLRDFSYKIVTHARVFVMDLKQELNIMINNRIGIYLVGLLKYLNQIYRYDDMCSPAKIKNNVIVLPYINNKIAFSYMEERIRELEQERIRELEAYLIATGLNGCDLNENDTGGGNPIDHFLSNDIKFKEFKIGELFDIKSTIKKFNANEIMITDDYNLHPYVARGSSNNGIKGYINEDEKYLNQKNTFAFGQDTATCFYQEKPYFTGDKIKILSSKYFKLNQQNSCYIISAINKTLKKLKWGQSSFSESMIKNIKLILPIDPYNQPDFLFMENFIKDIEKLVIKGVIKWKDKIINTTKEVIENN